MAAKHTLSEALKTIRKARGLSQEAFSDVSSRTYMSTLERDLKSPTLNKLAELCEVMEVHPLTLLTLAYAGDDRSRSISFWCRCARSWRLWRRRVTRHSARPRWRGRSGSAGSGTAGAPSIARRG